jgi:RTX calcium-binding nonapeptide repeat (4 copies)
LITLRAVVARIVVVAGTLALCLLSSPAHASSVAVVGEELLIGDNSGETNSIAVEVVGKRIFISDPAGLDPGKGCQDNGGQVTCKAQSVVLVSIQTGDLDDTVRVSGIEAFIDVGPGDDRVVLRSQASVVGGLGNDRLTGGKSKDVLRGGSGNDTLTGGHEADVLRGGGGDDRIEAQDGWRDRVFGGRGWDQADVDCEDREVNTEEGSILCD